MSLDQVFSFNIVNRLLRNLLSNFPIVLGGADVQGQQRGASNGGEQRGGGFSQGGSRGGSRGGGRDSYY